MQESHPLPATEMVRIPGLYRHWELSEVLTNHHAFRIEDAGAHQDGTPLLAIYAACDRDARTAEYHVPDGSLGPRPRPAGTIFRWPE